MQKLSRKQREILTRHELILDTAVKLIAEGGFGNFRMERIAELTEYSKGTIYQHFQCKEDVLIHLCMRGQRVWAEFFDRALRFQGLSRERLLAFHLAHELYAKLYPVEYASIYMVKSVGVREKISPERHAAEDELMKGILDKVAIVVAEGVALGDVTLPRQMTAQDLIYGFWATHYGNLMLETYNFSYRNMGISDPANNRKQMLRALLDGLPWRPVSHEHDYAATAQRIIGELFPEADQLQ
ncbi:MAG: TetR/AcrR family transcriptional regulator [Methylococcaceae bacterium]|nr:MAG: TetR/AcrR family transcriptional regulator [Methylococcaceae bacterium]